MFGGSDDRKDRRTSVEEFKQIFEKEIQSQLYPIFMRGFKHSYDSYKKMYQTKNVDRDIISTSFIQVLNNLGFAQDVKEEERLKEAEYLGNALGIFLAIIDYGICSVNYILKPWDANEYIGDVTEIRKRLDNLKRNIKVAYIKKRTQKIAKRHIGTLPKEKMDLLLKIANVFI